jgi:hypothetical protein
VYLVTTRSWTRVTGDFQAWLRIDITTITLESMRPFRTWSEGGGVCQAFVALVALFTVRVLIISGPESEIIGEVPICKDLP